MDKKEAIEKLKANSWEYEKRYFRYELAVNLEDAQEIIEQIHEPQKAVIPKFAANWIKYYKDKKLGLYRTIASRTMSKEHGWMGMR